MAIVARSGPGAGQAVGGVGESVTRPDAPPKAEGSFAFASDLVVEGMLWTATVRSEHPAGRLVAVDTTAARRAPGVVDVVDGTALAPGATVGEFGDQPPFASGVVRHVGEPVATVAAATLAEARAAARLIRVEVAPTDPCLDPEAATSAAPVHPQGNVLRELHLRRGDPDATGDVVVEGVYRTPRQDQLPLGPEACLAVPDAAGSVVLHASTRSVHRDKAQVAACLGLDPERLRVVLAGVGGAFGARNELWMLVHATLLARRTGRAVRMALDRWESFASHDHRHPARIRMRTHASRDGRLVKIEADLLLDGGAYATESPYVLGVSVPLTAGPYRVPNAVVDGRVVRTNNPPSGAMRGFGTPQPCFAIEAQMDDLAAVLGLDPLELRLRNLLASGDQLITGQRIGASFPAAEVLGRVRDAPLPRLAPPPPAVRRRVGYAIGMKNCCYTEGFDDDATAEIELTAAGVIVRCAGADVGQGVTTVLAQVARSVLDAGPVTVVPPDTDMHPAGDTGGSRQTWMSGGAVRDAAEAVRAELLARAAGEWGESPAGLELTAGRVRSAATGRDVGVADLLGTSTIRATRTHHHPATGEFDDRVNGDAFVAFSLAAHRVVADIDPELGTTAVRHVTTAVDCGRAINPLALTGQVEGAVAQGLGYALLEDVRIVGGRVVNGDLHGYPAPTSVDVPEIRVELVEDPHPDAPFGAKGAGESPLVAVAPAVAAAVRSATGQAVDRLPIHPGSLETVRSLVRNDVDHEDAYGRADGWG